MRVVLLLLLIASLPVAGRSGQLTSLVLEDHHGLHEKVTARDRLTNYQKLNWLTPQPYRKVVRTYARGRDGAVGSFITTYHPTGQLKQYLQIVDGRAQGCFCEWYADGALKIASTLVGGPPEIGEEAAEHYLFDGVTEAFHGDGQLAARLPYSAGQLEGVATYYHPDGSPREVITYEQGVRHGPYRRYGVDGALREERCYVQGLLDGPSVGRDSTGSVLFEEVHERGLLREGCYRHPDAGVTQGCGKRLVWSEEGTTELIDYRNGQPWGNVEVRDARGRLLRSFHVEGEQKHGPETLYYPPHHFATAEADPIPRLQLEWCHDELQGEVRTWYPSGMLESQREMAGNSISGLSMVWYEEGALMLVEEYRDNLLLKGEYFEPGSACPISQVRQGTGTATLFDGQGHVTARVAYLDGLPVG
jgi:antitoxin component YwqK of YwqJK toxin-antitoxin module